MKKLFAMLCAGALFVSCSQDTSLEVPKENNLDITKIEALSTLVPDASFDESELGLYRGIFASADVSLHGEVIVSVKSDEEVSALVVLTNQKKLYFTGTSLGAGNYSFASKEASFSLNLSNPNKVVVTESNYNNRGINLRIIKDRSDQRGVAVLGTFADDTDPGFNGTWNYLSWSPSSITGTLFGVPVTIPVFNINEVVITFDDGTPSGAMYTDDSMETFIASGAACAAYPLPTTPTTPFFTGPLNDFPVPPFGVFDLNEDVAFGQTSVINGFDVQWSLGYSLLAGTPGVRAYIGTDTDDCAAATSGRWEWKGRTGVILFN